MALAIGYAMRCVLVVAVQRVMLQCLITNNDRLNRHIPTATTLQRNDYGITHALTHTHNNRQALVWCRQTDTKKWRKDEKKRTNEIKLCDKLTCYLQCSISADSDAGCIFRFTPIYARILFTFVLHHSAATTAKRKRRDRTMSKKKKSKSSKRWKGKS